MFVFVCYVVWFVFVLVCFVLFFLTLSPPSKKQDVVKWCITELKLPEDVAEDYEARLASPPLGVACVDDLRWLLEEDMELLEINVLHKRKIMAWVAKNKP